MSPTVLRSGPFRFFFFSREEARLHVHVGHPDGEAKFWLEPEVELAANAGLDGQQVRDAQERIIRHKEEIIHAWKRHFRC